MILIFTEQQMKEKVEEVKKQEDVEEKSSNKEEGDRRYKNLSLINLC